jgi:hypothetical protein
MVVGPWRQAWAKIKRPLSLANISISHCLKYLVASRQPASFPINRMFKRFRSSNELCGSKDGKEVHTIVVLGGRGNIHVWQLISDRCGEDIVNEAVCVTNLAGSISSNCRVQEES